MEQTQTPVSSKLILCVLIILVTTFFVSLNSDLEEVTKEMQALNRKLDTIKVYSLQTLKTLGKDAG